MDIQINPCPCIFIKIFGKEFVIIAVYVDDINIIETLKELPKTINCLKKEFEMKDLGKTKLCLTNWVFGQWNICTSRRLYRKSVKTLLYEKISSIIYSNSCLIIGCEKRSFRPRKKDEELISPEVSYLSAIGTLMYLANYTRPDISCIVNLLARYISSPTQRH